MKKLLAPVLGERTYSVLQAVSMAWDIRSGNWTEPELQLIRYAVRSGETVLDIGANYGLYAYHLSRAVGSQGRVYCFEPVPFTNRTFKLVSRLLRFSAVELVEKGCADRNGTISFTVPLTDSGSISAGQVHSADRNNERDGRDTHARFEKTRIIEAEVVALDAFLPEVNELSFIKCDIEGADLYAMKGARGLLEKHHPTVVIEINPWFLEGFGLKVDDVVGFFEGLGYGLYRFEKGRLKPYLARDVVEDNWIFVHPRRLHRLAPLLTPA